MYTGTIKTKPHYNKKPFRQKIQMLQTSETQINGVISNKLEFKTIDYKQDYTIKVRDFDILNLMAINAIGELKEVHLNQSFENIEKQADKANNYLDKIELIKEIEDYGQSTETQNNIQQA